MSKMTQILVTIGCPSGSTNWGNSSIPFKFQKDLKEILLRKSKNRQDSLPRNIHWRVMDND